ncbi:MAG TPA: pyruvate dehydrogenase (acetyl-transferring), homodimeric type [Actinomycetota bacterium]|nr:pyruvate dehydrogenase (acetyl-transferring), homodimeric type [Actinomycetota bacterium]
MTTGDFQEQIPDVDPGETQEWLESLRQMAGTKGPARASYVLRRLLAEARRLQIGVPPMVSTNYVNTIAPEDEPPFPGDEEMEARIRRLIRWNAAVMVLRANIRSPGLGGHLSTYASAASLYEVAFNHFFRGKDHPGGGDQIFYQGHATPGIYARSYLEYRFDEDRMDRFRREVGGLGLSSYPHARLMPAYWEFPTVSMGLGPINAVYQARFNRYLHARGIKDTSQQRVWAFIGDGEMDEPESTAGLGLAAREGLDNLVFVVNCNLQRLDGPVRGNGKVIQELESLFRGAGWHVIKVVWGREWDSLLARDVDGVLVDKMNTTTDGEFQRYAVSDGGYIREHFFGPDPRLRKLVENLSDADLQRLRRGGHDYRKLYAAYWAATELEGAPVVILAKTVKGWALGESIEARNVTHQAKKMTVTDLQGFRDRLGLPLSDRELDSELPPYYRPPRHTSTIEYMLWRRSELGGLLPERRVSFDAPKLPAKEAFDEFWAGTEERKVEASTTQAFVRMLRVLLRDESIGKRIVPIIPDEARTFGMESLFKQLKIYNPLGQRYEPVDVETLLPYLEATDGQVLEEGITEAGSMAAFSAAGTAYATHGELTIPFFIFYSMFGFQRVGDLIWAFGDARGRGFLLGATAGRTTLLGEGLQHQDGHSLLLASTVPNIRAYDPAYAYELATVLRDGLRRMYEDGEDVFYYVTLYNENYVQPKIPRGVTDGIVKGVYRFKRAQARNGPRVQLLASGPSVKTALEAQSKLKEDFGVAADVWSATSYQQLRNEALACERWNRLHPADRPRVPYVSEALDEAEGPVVAVSDFMKSVPDQISRWVREPFVSLGTDGFGRSDTRKDLRRHFEIDAGHITASSLHALALAGEMKPEKARDAIEAAGIDPEAVEPREA